MELRVGIGVEYYMVLVEWEVVWDAVGEVVLEVVLEVVHEILSLPEQSFRRKLLDAHYFDSVFPLPFFLAPMPDMLDDSSSSDQEQVAHPCFSDAVWLLVFLTSPSVVLGFQKTLV